MTAAVAIADTAIDLATDMRAAARCIERLRMDGATIRRVETSPMSVRVEIEPPPAAHALWQDCGAHKITPTEITYATVRFGCVVRWTLARTEFARYAETLRDLAAFFEDQQ